MHIYIPRDLAEKKHRLVAESFPRIILERRGQQRRARQPLEVPHLHPVHHLPRAPPLAVIRRAVGRVSVVAPRRGRVEVEPRRTGDVGGGRSSGPSLLDPRRLPLVLAVA